jgi:DNA (cytosine-5)-methyltransferase 1
MTHLDLFTGIGGFRLAAEWAGFKTVGFSEIDPFCCRLLEQKWPGIKNYGDIRTRSNFETLRKRIGVISAGVPCQPASIAGQRRGSSDDRWLWPAALELIRYLEPAWVILENPYGILSLWNIHWIFAHLGNSGYTSRCFGIPATAIGARHLRQRLFIVANAGCSGLSSPECKAFQGEGRRHEGRTITEFSSPEFDPGLLRAIHGIRNRRDRIKALGNAVVPAQAYPIFEAIAQAEEVTL